MVYILFIILYSLYYIKVIALCEIQLFRYRILRKGTKEELKALWQILTLKKILFVLVLIYYPTTFSLFHIFEFEILQSRLTLISNFRHWKIMKF